MIIIISLIFLCLFLWIRLSGSNKTRKIQKEQAAFWEKEKKSNFVRKADISGLNYIKIPLEKLPLTKSDDPTLNSLYDTIIGLSKSSVLNLTGISNTDLKLKYGVANITFLSECDNNYTVLVNSLYKWGQYLYDHNRIPEAVQVLEFGIQCHTDVSKHYLLLAEIYKESNALQKIDELIPIAESLNTMMKDKIITSLREIKLSSLIV
jgi:hypothetical protein